MGASGWRYSTAFDPSFEVALARLQQEVFDSGDFLWQVMAWDPATQDYAAAPRPASLAELERFRDTEEFWHSGTHTVLDMVVVTDPDDEDFGGSVRPLAPQEVLELLGSDRPGVEDFDRAYAADGLDDGIGRWSGRCTVLYDADRPVQCVFWGVSGD